MVNIYCDGVFDLFHLGHRKHLQQIKQLYKDVYLIVGVISDHETGHYKRNPILKEEVRYYLINCCKYVDLAIKNAPPFIDIEFLDKYQIDLVVHAFADETDFQKQEKWFQVPISLGKFKRFAYNQGISTTAIINSDNWKLSENITKHDNYNEQPNNPINSTVKIGINLDVSSRVNARFNYLKTNLGLSDCDLKTATLLEVNNEMGELGSCLAPLTNYTGISKYQDQVTYQLHPYKYPIICADIDTEGLIFKDRQFDYLIAHNLEVTSNYTIDELKRVSKKAVYLSYSIPIHIQYLDNFIITNGEPLSFAIFYQKNNF